MMNTKVALKQLMATHFITVDVPCPECGGAMTAWKEPTPDTPPRCPPVCMECGYRSVKKKEATTAKNLYESSLIKKAKDYFLNGSVLTDRKSLHKKIGNYYPSNQESTKAKNISMEFCEKTLLGEIHHLILTGGVGVGKSHLAIGCLNEILVKSNYSKKVLFVSYRELLEQLKFAMNDEEARKAITGVAMSEIKAADVVVLDDIGAELGDFNKRDEKGNLILSRASNFDIDTLTGILESRIDKPTIITSNLKSKEIKYCYGERIVSRMATHSNGFMHRFTNTKDYRLKTA